MGDSKPRPGWRVIFCKSFIHWRSKKRVYRKNGGYFRFYVRVR
jgi:hypothetical protein